MLKFTFWYNGRHRIDLRRKTSLPRVYSYVGFSTPEQLKGDSLRRQMEMGQAWCDRHPGHYLDDGLRLQDLGVSAFKGRNQTEGALGAFVEAIETAKVKKGSVLLVEVGRHRFNGHVRPRFPVSEATKATSPKDLEVGSIF